MENQELSNHVIISPLNELDLTPKVQEGIVKTIEGKKYLMLNDLPIMEIDANIERMVGREITDGDIIEIANQEQYKEDFEAGKIGESPFMGM